MTMRPLAIATLLLLAGCKTDETTVPRAPVATPDAAPVVAGQMGKDETVVQSADKIDEIVKDEPKVAEPVKVETDRIREAVTANPASDIKRLADQFDEAIRLLRGQLTAADKRAEQLAAQIERLRDAEQRAQVRDLRYLAFGALGIAALLGWAKQIQFAAIFAIGGVLAFGLAQLVSQPWFMSACSVVVALILAGVTWAAAHAYRKHELAAKVEKEAAKLKDTLVRVVPAVDSAIEEVGEAGAKIKAKLRAAMAGAAGKQAKATVHEIRAAAKLGEASS